jgi:hypothetical protein
MAVVQWLPGVATLDEWKGARFALPDARGEAVPAVRGARTAHSSHPAAGLCAG